VEAERAVLGSIMLNNSAMEEASVLRDLDFSQENHRAIFRTMTDMFEAGEPIDIVSLPEKMNGNLKEVGGIAYLAQLSSGIPRSSHINNYVRIVRSKAVLRRVIEISDLAQSLAFEGGDEEAIADETAKGLLQLISDYADKARLGEVSKKLKVSAIKQLEGKKNFLRVNTGITELDKLTGGFRAGELIVITASETGSGKTLLAQQIRTHACRDGLHGIYFSGEMPGEQLVSREMASEAGIPHWKMRRPENLTKEEYKALVENAMRDCEVCRIVDGELSLRGIKTACRSMKADNRLSWAVVDYDELVDAPGRDEISQQRTVIREAKRLAMQMEIPLIVISGIRKPMDSKDAGKPMLSRIYGTGAKSKHSSFVLFVDRKYVRELKGSESDASIFILKSRDGRVGKIPAKFNLNTLRFEDAEPEKPKDRDYTQEPEDS
jgi:replicative DNA helicase